MQKWPIQFAFRLRISYFRATENNTTFSRDRLSQFGIKIRRFGVTLRLYKSKMSGLLSVVTSLVSREKYGIRIGHAKCNVSSVTVSYYLWQAVDSSCRWRSVSKAAALRITMTRLNTFRSDVSAPFLLDTKICLRTRHAASDSGSRAQSIPSSAVTC
jgi:hypothetical protein